MSDLDHFKALFLLAGFKVSNWHELPNGYWPDAYVELRKDHPWQLAITEYGPIRIGWRKRVISIDWRDTAVRKVITVDDVTKGETDVHAWSLVKALEYLTALHGAARSATSGSEGEGRRAQTSSGKGNADA